MAYDDELMHSEEKDLDTDETSNDDLPFTGDDDEEEDEDDDLDAHGMHRVDEEEDEF